MLSKDFLEHHTCTIMKPDAMKVEETLVVKATATGE